MYGSVKIIGAKHTGMIRFGTGEIGMFDKRFNRPIWENKGAVEFSGDAVIKFGAAIIVGPSGQLKLGSGFRISSGSYIICYKSVIIGHNSRISWDCRITDTDFHKVLDQDLNRINPDKDIVIGNNCWIGSQSSVLKGSRLSDMVVLASGSMINRPVSESNVILAGSPAKIVRTGISWKE